GDRANARHEVSGRDAVASQIDHVVAHASLLFVRCLFVFKVGYESYQPWTKCMYRYQLKPPTRPANRTPRRLPSATPEWCRRNAVSVPERSPFDTWSARR